MNFQQMAKGKTKIVIILFFYFLLISADIFSQVQKYDRIYKNDKSFFDAIIIDNTSSQIKYRLPGTGDEIQIIPKSEVNYILHPNGKKEYIEVIEEPKKEVKVDPSPVPVLSQREFIRPKSNMLGLYFNSGTVIGKSSKVDSTVNFPLGTGLGGTIQFQHFFADSGIAVYIGAGWMKWISEGTDTIIGAIISNKLRAIPVQIGFKFYKKYFYGFVEGGIHNIKKTSSAKRDDVDKTFLLVKGGDEIKTSLSFAGGIGYEIKVSKKSFLDLNVRYYFCRKLTIIPVCQFKNCRYVTSQGLDFTQF